MDSLACEKVSSDASTVATIDQNQVVAEKLGIDASLFIASSAEAEIRICELDAASPFCARDFRGGECISQQLTGLRPRRASSRVFIICQQTSRMPLDVTASVFDSLVTVVKAFPGLAKTVNCFAQDDTDCYVGRAAVYFSHFAESPQKLETCCLLKFVEPNRRGQGVFGYSIRQMGFYDAWDPDTAEGTSILIQPSKMVWQQLQGYQNHAITARPWENWLHLTPMLVGTLVSGWSSYVGRLHQEVSKINFTAAFYDARGALRVTAANTLKRSAMFKDRVHQALHALQSNHETLQTVLTEFESRQKRNKMGMMIPDAEFRRFHSAVEDTIRELCFVQNQIRLIGQRLDQATETFRDLATIESSNFMAELTVKSTAEAKAVHIIALLTFLLLPPTFTAGFLEMGFIHVVSYERGFLSLHADPGLILYVAITMPLMIVTLGCWVVWNWRSRIKATWQQQRSIV